MFSERGCKWTSKRSFASCRSKSASCRKPGPSHLGHQCVSTIARPARRAKTALAGAVSPRSPESSEQRAPEGRYMGIACGRPSGVSPLRGLVLVSIVDRCLTAPAKAVLALRAGRAIVPTHWSPRCDGLGFRQDADLLLDEANERLEVHLHPRSENIKQGSTIFPRDHEP